MATVALVIVAVFWYYYQQTTPKLDRDPIVNQALYLMLGAWVANIAYGVQKSQQEREQKREDRTVEAEKRATVAESKANEALETAKGDHAND